MQNPSWISMPCVSSSRSMLSSSSRRVSSSFWSWDVSAHRVIANHAKQCHRRNKTYINPQTDTHQYKLYVNEARTRRRRRRRKATTTQGSIRLWGNQTCLHRLRRSSRRRPCPPRCWWCRRCAAGAGQLVTLNAKGERCW